MVYNICSSPVSVVISVLVLIAVMLSVVSHICRALVMEAAYEFSTMVCPAASR